MIHEKTDVRFRKMKISDILSRTEYDSYKNPKEGKTYISPPFENQFGELGTIRIVTRAIDQNEAYEMAKEKGEIVLRTTPGGKNIIKAKVFEDSRKIHILNIQEYTAATENPHKKGFAFVGDEITKLFNFIRDVQTMEFGAERYQRLDDDDINHIQLTDTQAASFFQRNPELFSSIIQSQMTTKDIVAYGYRKKQLEYFDKLLHDSFFLENELKQKAKSKEALWQCFFEANPWIFGYGLGYIFLSNLDNKKLEQVVQGYSINHDGKRIDAVMKTKGIISNLCFIEIKTHLTALLEDTPYRSGCYAPSKELSGAVSQVQGSTAEAVRNLTEKIATTDSDGNPTGEIVYNYQPKSFLVIGNLEQFAGEYGVNEKKLRSFELYRKNIVSPEIITFDELYERAKFIVEYSESNK